jgi:hypothetical protein
MTTIEDPVAKSSRTPDDLCDFLQPVCGGRNGDIPTIKIGKLMHVSVRALEQKLDAAMKSGADR